MAFPKKIQLGKCNHEGLCRDCCLHIAVQEGAVESVKELLAAGADVNLLWDGKNLIGERCNAAPLRKAGNYRDRFCSEKQIQEIVEILVANGADIDLKNRHGQTPLHWAVVNGHLCVVEALLKHQPDVNTTDMMDGDSPLHSVASSDIERLDTCRAELGELLLKHGANFAATNHRGETPVDIARRKEHRLSQMPNSWRQQEEKERRAKLVGSFPTLQEEKERRARDEERQRIQRQRRSRSQCVKCGQPLGLFAKLLRQDSHLGGCSPFRK